MTNTIYLLNYNNYYNREFKKEKSLDDYFDYVVATSTGINFATGDHISTNIVVNISDDTTPDYVLVVESNEIVSRWFILESQRIRGGQYNLTLYRDTIADYEDVILHSPCFIEKALVQDTDSAIYNAEDMTFNRIKKSETLLKDNTNTSWLVAYIARDEAATIEGEVVPPNEVDIIAERSAWEYKDYINGAQTMVGNVTNSEFEWRMYGGSDNNPTYLSVKLMRADPYSSIVDAYSKYRPDPLIGIASPAAAYDMVEFYNAYRHTYAGILDYLPTAAGITVNSNSVVNSFLGLNGATIRFTDSTTIYKINIVGTSKTQSVPVSLNATVPNGDPLFNYVYSVWGSDVILASQPQSNNAYGRWQGYSFTYTEYTMELIPQGVSDALIYNVPISRTHLEDAPYDMICTPYDNIEIKLDASTTAISNTATVMTVFTDIARKYAGGTNPVVYDIQRLPYCPIPRLIEVNGVLDATAWSGDNQAYTIVRGTANAGVIFACKRSNFTLPISLETPISIDNKKIQTQCDSYRICSPNYNGAFDFDPAMNNGLIGFTAYCSYKPFNPYVQVSPIFNADSLYGNNYGDARGLICGGQWSLPIITDAWETYERQNVNYLNTFDRQIENMRITHKVQREQEIWSAVAGTLQGGVSGAAVGLMSGGGIYGAIAGGIAGTVTSGLGGIRDVQLNTLLRNEAIDYTMDQFGYQLGNIQALPVSLARTSAFTVNNKVYPFLEYYTCTEEEKRALANKIAHNGMTVMRIGKIIDYIENTWSYDDIVARNYIKGKIIKCIGLEDEYHVANTIAKELNQGIYFGGQ